MKTRFPKVRSRIERGFIAWYRAHETEFNRPLLFVSRTDGHLSLTQPGLSPAIKIYLNSWELEVCVEWQGKYWDVLMSDNTCPELTDKGYFESFKLSDYQVFYESREALWEAELFKPFMNWLNNELLSAKWLGLYKLDEPNGEMARTWAELLTEPDPETFVLLPVWLDSSEDRQPEKHLVSQPPTHN